MSNKNLEKLNIISPALLVNDIKRFFFLSKTTHLSIHLKMWCSGILKFLCTIDFTQNNKAITQLFGVV